MGAPRLLVGVTAALSLAVVSSAAAAKGDLKVTVGKLAPPKTIVLGQPAKFTVRYVVRGPLARRAQATVRLTVHDNRNRYLIVSDPAHVSPAIWTWSVTDHLPERFDAGPYKVTVIVTLKRGKTTVDRATVTKAVTVTAPPPSSTPG